MDFKTFTTSNGRIRSCLAADSTPRRRPGTTSDSLSNSMARTARLLPDGSFQEYVSQSVDIQGTKKANKWAELQMHSLRPAGGRIATAMPAPGSGPCWTAALQRARYRTPNPTVMSAELAQKTLSRPSQPLPLRYAFPVG